MAQLPHHRLLLHYCSAPRRFCGGDAVTQWRPSSVWECQSEVKASLFG
jgi:hypothetical protein